MNEPVTNKSIDFSKYYLWDDSKDNAYNLEQKQVWTKNAEESYQKGYEAYVQLKPIDQNPFIKIVKIVQRLVDNLESEINTILEQSLNPQNNVSCMCSRFEHNREWWKRGWKTAYQNHTESGERIVN